MKDRTPRRLRRSLCGVPNDNHEVEPDEGAVWTCRAERCAFLGSQEEATAHVIAYQFSAERGQDQ